MEIEIDFRSDEPIYIQIVEQIRRLVATGELKQGDQLPTVRQLASDLRVNFNTVARAYRLLDEAGLISTQQGRGTYIWEQPTPETRERLRNQQLDALTQRYLSEVTRLGFTSEQVSQAITEKLKAWENGNPPSET